MKRWNIQNGSVDTVGALNSLCVVAHNGVMGLVGLQIFSRDSKN